MESFGNSTLECIMAIKAVSYTHLIVFISYSQDSLSFADQVLSFANKLRREGIDAILDQYEEAPSEGWPRWMENSINRADYVIAVSYTHLWQANQTLNIINKLQNLVL